MFRNINLSLRAFFHDRQGAIMIELAFVLLLMMAILAFMAASIEKQAVRGKLDRTVYSLASILRERGKFFSRQEELTDKDLQQLTDVAKAMLPQGATFALQIAFMTFTADKTIDRRKTEKFEKRVAPQASGFTCRLADMPDHLKELSAKSSSTHRWVPLYRVTLCVPVTTFIPDIFGLFGPPETVNIQSSAVMLSRKSG